MSYLNSRNQDFRIEDELFDLAQSVQGHIARFKNRLSNPLTYTRDLENDRDAEGQVFINGLLMPGIFQGFRIGGGIITERVDRQRLRKEAREAKKSEIQGLKAGRTLFQIDKGLVPIRFDGRPIFDGIGKGRTIRL